MGIKTPQQLAIEINAQEAAERKMRIEALHDMVLSAVYSQLLGKWLEEHRDVGTGGFQKPTVNDMRWLAKIAMHLAPFPIEAAGLIRLTDPKFNALAGIPDGDFLEFSGLFTTKPDQPTTEQGGQNARPDQEGT